MTIALTGGIGSGKSVVAAILTAMGYDVYDCDSRAKMLMNSSSEIKDAIASDICPDAITRKGAIDRNRLASVVFSDNDKLELLNRAVHGAVKTDLRQWIESRSAYKPRFVETAILYQSGLDRMVDKVWDVTADRETRLCRVMRRNGLCRDDVAKRIDTQDSYRPARLHDDISVIVNDGLTPVLPRVEELLRYLA